MKTCNRKACQVIMAMMVLGIFAFSTVVYADATIVDNLDMNGSGNTSFGIYQDGSLLVEQQEQINGSINRTRTISIDTSDDELRDYVDSKETEWSTSLVNENSISNIIGQSVSYLEGEDYNSAVAADIAKSLDSYFASDADVQQLLRMIDDLQFKTSNLNIRVAAIERTLEEMAGDDYCNAKLETARKYNLSIKGLKCGLNSTYFYANPDGTMTVIETYDPTVDPRPVKMTLVLPSAVFAGNIFNAGILLNNSASKFGAYKIVVTLPEGWTADETTFSGTIADKETKMIYIKVTPDVSRGNLSVGAKIVLSGKTYKLVAQSDLTPVVLEEGAPAPEVKEEDNVFITANLLSNLEGGLGKLASGTSDALKNISGNITQFIENVTGNSSDNGNGMDDAKRAMSDFDGLFGSVSK